MRAQVGQGIRAVEIDCPLLVCRFMSVFHKAPTTTEPNARSKAGTFKRPSTDNRDHWLRSEIAPTVSAGDESYWQAKIEQRSMINHTHILCLVHLYSGRQVGNASKQASK